MKQKEAMEVLDIKVFNKIFLIISFVFFSLDFSFSQEIDYDVVKKIQNYLNKITYLKAGFLQDDIKNSKLSEGVFYLRRPNKLKIDYTNPFKATLSINDKNITYYDAELEEKYTLKTSKTPLKFFLRKKIELTNKNLKITYFYTDANYTEIGITENKNTKDILYLKFKNNPLTLTNMRLKTDDEEVLLTFTKKSIDTEDFFKFE